MNNKECKHEVKIPVSDSLATACKECGKVWVDGDPLQQLAEHVFKTGKPAIGQLDKDGNFKIEDVDI